MANVDAGVKNSDDDGRFAGLYVPSGRRLDQVVVPLLTVGIEGVVGDAVSSENVVGLRILHLRPGFVQADCLLRGDTRPQSDPYDTQSLNLPQLLKTERLVYLELGSGDDGLPELHQYLAGNGLGWLGVAKGNGGALREGGAADERPSQECRQETDSKKNRDARSAVLCTSHADISPSQQLLVQYIVDVGWASVSLC